MSFHEVCKILVNTESAYKSGAPHLLVTGIGLYTQVLTNSVEFNYTDVYDREDKYNDIVGFYHTHPSGLNQMSPTDVETMTQWVKCLGKSLVCIIETDEQISGWLFVKEESGEITCRDVKVFSSNDVNYDVWLENKGDFWSPADFLLDENFEEEPSSDQIFMDNIQDSLNEILEKQKQILEGFNSLILAVEGLTKALTQDE